MIGTIEDFKDYIEGLSLDRPITTVQNHHTIKPGYEDFDGSNYDYIINWMRKYHTEFLGYSDIAQQVTTFPGGMLAFGDHGRSFERDPAGIRHRNRGAICIEHLGNFDYGNDTMEHEHSLTILKANKILSDKFLLPINTEHFVYHNWFDPKTGEKTGHPKKTCPGTNWYNGNSEKDAEVFLDLVAGISV